MEEPLAPNAASPPVAENRGRRHVVQPAVLLAAAALTLALWQWYDSRATVQALQQELARKLAEGEAQNKDSRAVAEQVREASREAQVKLGILEAKLAESQNQQAALETMYQELSRSRDESVLADVEQTLLVASQQLQIAGNVKAALIALAAADNRLARVERPQLASLRKVLGRDIERLKQVPFVDVVGISARLDNLAAAVDGWPLAIDVRPRETAAAPKAAGAQPERMWSRFWRELVGELRDLVRIENLDHPDTPLIAPGQAFFLRENLKLRLLSARIALLAHDGKTFQADLKAAREWLARYFDGRNNAVANAGVTLRSLSDSDISIELPDINASLDAVRNYRLTRERSR